MSKPCSNLTTKQLASLLRQAERRSYQSIVSCLGPPCLVACARGMFRICWQDSHLARWVPRGQDHFQVLGKDARPLFSHPSQLNELWRQYEALPVRGILVVSDDLTDLEGAFYRHFTYGEDTVFLNADFTAVFAASTDDLHFSWRFELITLEKTSYLDIVRVCKPADSSDMWREGGTTYETVAYLSGARRDWFSHKQEWQMRQRRVNQSNLRLAKDGPFHLHQDEYMDLFVSVIGLQADGFLLVRIVADPLFHQPGYLKVLTGKMRDRFLSHFVDTTWIGTMAEITKVDSDLVHYLQVN